MKYGDYSFIHRKDDCVKKLLVVFVFALLFVGCQSKDSKTGTNLVREDIIAISDNEDASNSLNDLVYHDYGSGIKLSSNSTLKITQIDLGIKDETAIIYAINLENGEIIKICDYQPDQDISFNPSSDGVYKIAAELSNGESIDLTAKAMVETSNTTENSNGFIPLN